MANLEKSYSAVYRGEKPERRVLQIRGWPRDRYEASVFWAPRGKRVLDVGCGNGVVLFNLKDRFGELYGLELSKARARGARKVLDGLNAQVIEGNIEEGTVFGDGFFDCVVCSDVIEHVVDVFAAFREISRIIKSGGCLVLNTPNFARIKGRLRLLLGRFPSTAFSGEGFNVRSEGELLDGGHLHYFTFSMLERLCRRFGFTDVKKYGFGRFGRLHNIYPPLLSGSCQIVARKTG